MAKKTILLVDDEQGFLEALSDALEFEGHIVLKAVTAEEGLKILEKEHVDLVTIDIMLPPGLSLESKTDSHNAGIYLCERIRHDYPSIAVLCISVISDSEIIRKIRKLGVRFVRKGETPLRTVLEIIQSRLGGEHISNRAEEM